MMCNLTKQQQNNNEIEGEIRATPLFVCMFVGKK